VCSVNHIHFNSPVSLLRKLIFPSRKISVGVIIFTCFAYFLSLVFAGLEYNFM
jgi:hypothetical protein